MCDTNTIHIAGVNGGGTDKWQKCISGTNLVGSDSATHFSVVICLCGICCWGRGVGRS